MLSYPRQYATALGNRLWKWYVTALGNHAKLPKTICNRFRQPLMEMVLALQNPSNRYTYSQEKLVSINNVTFKALCELN
jgi:hypothetical protein